MEMNGVNIMITKKITLLVFLIFCSINVFAKYKYEKLADFEWNNKSGFETVKFRC